MIRRETVDKTLSAHHHANAPLTLSAAPGGHTPPHTSSNLGSLRYCDGFLLLCLVRTVAEEERQKKLMARLVLTED
jgi:hypothetical protein